MSADFPLSFRHSFRSYQADTLCLQSINPIRKSRKSRHTHFQRYSEPVPSQPNCFQSPAISTRHRMRFTSFTLGFGGKTAIRTCLRSSFCKILPVAVCPVSEHKQIPLRPAGGSLHDRSRPHAANDAYDLQRSGRCIFYLIPVNEVNRSDVS